MQTSAMAPAFIWANYLVASCTGKARLADAEAVHAAATGAVAVLRASGLRLAIASSPASIAAAQPHVTAAMTGATRVGAIYVDILWDENRAVGTCIMCETNATVIHALSVAIAA
mmetsp:Transcript_70749/g.129144  ORF Transcript_70749/g.129144 Transcript_70749/m.129144 type:complete len:114 (+) Transcript_70749:1552-1893(+)